MDSTLVGRAVKALIGVEDKYALTVISILNALNKSNPEQADLMSGQLEITIRHFNKLKANQVAPNKPLTKVAKAVALALLVLVATVSVVATTVPFDAAEKFVVNTKADTKVKISGLWSNFETHFLGKVEPAFGGSELNVQKLLEKSLDKPIIDELGGEAKAETSLTEMFALMEKQGHGQEGTLLTNGWSNIFYIRDVNDVLWAVSCHWSDGGWDCGANSALFPVGWLAARQVISRNSVTV